MLKNLFLGLYTIFGLIAMFFFFLLTCDIIDGRDQKLPVSPHYHADVTATALGLSLFLMFVAFGVVYISVKMLSMNTRKKKKPHPTYKKNFDEWDTHHLY